MGDGEIAVNSTVNSKAFDSTNPICIFAIFCYTSFGNSKILLPIVLLLQLKSGFFAPLNAREKRQKNPIGKKNRI